MECFSHDTLNRGIWPQFNSRDIKMITVLPFGLCKNREFSGYLIHIDIAFYIRFVIFKYGLIAFVE